MLFRSRTHPWRETWSAVGQAGDRDWTLESTPSPGQAESAEERHSVIAHAGAGATGFVARESWAESVAEALPRHSQCAQAGRPQRGVASGVIAPSADRPEVVRERNTRSTRRDTKAHKGSPRAPHFCAFCVLTCAFCVRFPFRLGRAVWRPLSRDRLKPAAYVIKFGPEERVVRGAGAAAGFDIDIHCFALVR